MAKTGKAGLELIKHFEGYSDRVYICPAGYPTIGYGHVVLAHERDAFAAGISREQAESILRKDLGIAERSVERLIHAPLTNNQFDALVSFTFNLGGGALQRSTLRTKLNRGEYEAAAYEFHKWVFAGGKKLKGLILRRDAEADLFLNADIYD